MEFWIVTILLKNYCKFEQLLTEIGKLLQKDISTIDICMLFPPIRIFNDMGINTYVKLKKANPGMKTLLLCMSFSEDTVGASTSTVNFIASSLKGMQFFKLPFIHESDTSDSMSIAITEDDICIQLSGTNIITNTFYQILIKDKFAKTKSCWLLEKNFNIWLINYSQKMFGSIFTKVCTLIFIYVILMSYRSGTQIHKRFFNGITFSSCVFLLILSMLIFVIVVLIL